MRERGSICAPCGALASPAPRRGIEPLSDDRQSSRDTSRVTRHWGPGEVIALSRSLVPGTGLPGGSRTRAARLGNARRELRPDREMGCPTRIELALDRVTTCRHHQMASSTMNFVPALPCRLVERERGLHAAPRADVAVRVALDPVPRLLRASPAGDRVRTVNAARRRMRRAAAEATRMLHGITSRLVRVVRVERTPRASKARMRPLTPHPGQRGWDRTTDFSRPRGATCRWPTR